MEKELSFNISCMGLGVIIVEVRNAICLSSSLFLLRHHVYWILLQEVNFYGRKTSTTVISKKNKFIKALTSTYKLYRTINPPFEEKTQELRRKFPKICGFNKVIYPWCCALHNMVKDAISLVSLIGSLASMEDMVPEGHLLMRPFH